MKNTSILLTAVVTATAWSVHAANPDLSKLPPPAKQKGLTYAKDIKPIFEASCVRCHNEQRHKGGLQLTSLENALKGGEDGKVILPGQSAKSPLVVAVARLDEETAMPPAMKGRGPGGPGGPGGPPPGGPGGRGGRPGGPGGPPPKPLTPDQVGLIRAWIDQGAK